MNLCKLFNLVIIANLFFGVCLDPCTTINSTRFPTRRERTKKERECREKPSKRERERRERGVAMVANKSDHPPL